MTAPRLHAQGVSKSFGPRQVLVHLNLDLEPGTVTAITGHNGSGKSTFLRCVAGLAKFEGTILVDGLDSLSGRSRIGYLPQSVSFPGWPTVAEVIEFFARLRGVDPGAHPFDPEFLPDTSLPVRVLSGGQRQRVALAVSMLGGPPLILLDEPAASLDDEGRATLEQALVDATAEGASVLVATPRADDLTRAFDRVVGLAEGKLVERPGSTVTKLKVAKP
jgi:ABC-type multidrug transport system ATPase subunit